MSETNKKQKGKYSTVCTHLSEEEKQLLEAEAAEREWSMSKVVRKAVRKYFGLD